MDEIYRGLRTNIEFSQMDDAIQVINVVSTIPNEGKSTIACNLLVLWQLNIKMCY